MRAVLLSTRSAAVASTVLGRGPRTDPPNVHGGTDEVGVAHAEIEVTVAVS